MRLLRIFDVVINCDKGILTAHNHLERVVTLLAIRGSFMTSRYQSMCVRVHVARFRTRAAAATASSTASNRCSITKRRIERRRALHLRDVEHLLHTAVCVRHILVRYGRAAATCACTARPACSLDKIFRLIQTSEVVPVPVSVQRHEIR